MPTKLAVGGVGIAVCAAVLVFTGYALGAPKTPPKRPPKRPFSADQKTAGATAAQPFANNNGQIPPTSQYSGPLFQLSPNRRHLSLGPVPNPPWVQAIGGGRITPQNAAAYVAALKQYVAANAQTLIWNYPAWNASSAGWYNQPWLGSIRESIHGMYTGSEFPADTFPGTGLKKTITTYVLTYYDIRAAETLYRVWGSEAMNPRVTTTTTQFPEESVIVKAAFVDVTAADWPEMAGAAVWPLYIPINDTKTRPAVVQSSLMQFDIIVKDTRSAPRTGWVFATLVYDKNAPGSRWDKMVPLGAMWGNDPEVNSAANPHAPLQENWINTRAPLYSRQTLGWGGRLSGPNDGAVNAIQVGQQTYHAYPNSSCMSCHGPAEWLMGSFLLPATTNPQPTFSSNGTYLLSPAPGSPDWMKWFQSRPGNVPQDAGTVALDYDMVFAFKSLPLWSKATGKPVPMLARPGHRTVTPPETNYNGMPIR